MEQAGESTLNHFFLQLMSQLLFFPMRAGLPHFDVLTGAGREKGAMLLTSYQYDLSGQLRPTPAEMYGASAPLPKPHMDVLNPSGSVIGRASFAKWQDGAYVIWPSVITQNRP